MIIVGVSGKLQSGKGVFTQTLLDAADERSLYGYRASFARVIKSSVVNIFDLSYPDVNTQEGKDRVLDHFGGITVREILQKFGTEVGRNIYPDIWVYHLLKDIRKAKFVYGCNLVVVDDLRFPNEYEALKKKGAVLVRIERPQLVLGVFNKHASESELDEIDEWHYKFINEELDEFKVEVKEFANKLLDGEKFILKKRG